jgi:5-methylcytosine-specific restriction endonuclease McrA
MTVTACPNSVVPKRKAKSIYNDPRWAPLRLRVLREDMGVCQVRGPRCRGTATTVDHIEPLERGGAPFDRANVRAACTTCNYGRRTMPTPIDKGIDPTPSRVW